jgi:IS4 transposase
LFSNGILATGYHQIGKLRFDANLRYLYTGEQKPKGRPKLYGDKIVIGDVEKLEFVEKNEIGIEIYTAIVNCVSLKRNIRLVLLKFKTRFAILFSTDTELDAKTVFRYYKARFQIEFLFRDAKQFTELTHCQARSKTALDNHFNASFSALNLIKWHDRQQSQKRKPISISYWKRIFFNTLFLERISCNSAFDLNSIKSTPAYSELCHFGIAC